VTIKKLMRHKKKGDGRVRDGIIKGRGALRGSQ